MILILVIILLSYSIYFFLKPVTISRLGDEDHFFEWISALCLLASSVTYFLSFRHFRNYFFLLLAIVFFLGFFEEISWAQRILNFTTPEKIVKINVQKEFSIHNIEIFNSSDLSFRDKHGLKRLLEINFLFRAGTIFLGIIFPLLVFHLRFVNWFTQKIRIPVPPVSLGIFFAINWILYRILHTSLLLEGQTPKYYSAASEIFESISCLIMLFISYYFYSERNVVVPGKDIKQCWSSAH